MLEFKSDLAKEITLELSKDSRTEGAGIEVMDDGAGVITLSGTISSEEIRAAAEEIAREHEGVTTVVSDMKVEPENRTLWPWS